MCHGDLDDADTFYECFFTLNGNCDRKVEADGMLSAFILRGCKENVCREVLKIGGKSRNE